MIGRTSPSASRVSARLLWVSGWLGSRMRSRSVRFCWCRSAACRNSGEIPYADYRAKSVCAPGRPSSERVDAFPEHACGPLRVGMVPGDSFMLLNLATGVDVTGGFV